jgi:hypothetical protein
MAAIFTVRAEAAARTWGDELEITNDTGREGQRGQAIEDDGLLRLPPGCCQGRESAGTGSAFLIRWNAGKSV